MLADDGEEGSATLTWRLLYSPSTGIAGGTNEVQRSIIGERVLGLPREAPPVAAAGTTTGPPAGRRPAGKIGASWAPAPTNSGRSGDRASEESAASSTKPRPRATS